jgi:hypothetical protein
MPESLKNYLELRFSIIIWGYYGWN